MYGELNLKGRDKNLISCYQREMKLRPATIEDALVLFKWRNDELTRVMSVNDAPIEWEGHLRWLTLRLSGAAPGLYIGEDGEPVGTVRIDGDEISYTVSPAHRGKGVATSMLTLAREQFGRKTARIKADNTASIAAASKADHTVEILP